jgi:tetratricopeptide (TPR) repeat protein
MEDLGRVQEAISGYQRCLALAPDLADAHYNLARLLHKCGDAQGALRHFNAYRRHRRAEDPLA